MAQSRLEFVNFKVKFLNNGVAIRVSQTVSILLAFFVFKNHFDNQGLNILLKTQCWFKGV